jgi:hypothetical protein
MKNYQERRGDVILVFIFLIILYHANPSHLAPWFRRTDLDVYTPVVPNRIRKFSKLRTGSVGNRTAEDMVRTLVEPKKKVISGVRENLLNLGFLEDVEYDAINIEPVLMYSKSEKKLVFLKHKWDLVAMIPLKSSLFPQGLQVTEVQDDLLQFRYSDEEGNHWLKFSLPKNESELYRALKAS